MQIRMIDLAQQNEEIRREVEHEMTRVHASTSYIGGPQVAEFEEEFAVRLGVRRVVGVGSGTDALRLALIALGVGRDDEVITTPMTFIATAEAIVQAGATPVFVDVDPSTRNMSPTGLRHYLEARRWRSANGPRAILPVHLYGSPAPLKEIQAIAQAHRLPIVEDACQAHGARLRFGDRWKAAGSIGAAGCFSFYPGKNLAAWGEAGAVATDDEDLAGRVSRLRDHGRVSHYGHLECGYNARLDTIQAVVLRAKLKRLESWNARRRELASAYRVLLGDTSCELPAEFPDRLSCYHLFVIQTPFREALRRTLLEHQVECGVHYPLPLHLQPALSFLGYRRGDFPASESVADSVLSLPIHPHLSDHDVLRVAQRVADSLGEMTALRTARADRSGEGSIRQW